MASKGTPVPGKRGKSCVVPPKGRASLLHYFSSSPAGRSATPVPASSSAPTTSSPQRAMSTSAASRASVEARGNGSNTGPIASSSGQGGRALAATRSEPALPATTSRSTPQAGNPGLAPQASSTLQLQAGSPGPRRSPRQKSTTPQAVSQGPASSTRTIKPAVKKEESLSPMKAKLRSGSLKPVLTASQAQNSKGKGKIIELSDSDDEERSRAPVLAPSSVSSATRQKRREAWARRTRRGKDGREEIDLTFSSSSGRASPPQNDDDDSSGEEIVVLSRPSSPASSRPSSTSRNRARQVTVSPRHAISPKGKGKERDVEADMMGVSASQVPSTVPAVSSPLAMPLPTTPRKTTASKVHTPTPSPVTPRTLRSSSKTQSLPIFNASAATPSSATAPRTRSVAAAGGTPQVTLTGATSSTHTSPRGLAPTLNVAVLISPYKPRNGSGSGSGPALSPLTSLSSESDLPSLTPSAPATPERRAGFAALLTSNRTPGGGPAYTRAPTGSPLSSAGPTPEKLLLSNGTWPGSSKPTDSRQRIPHAFELVIPIHPSSAARMKAQKKALQGKLRRERAAPTSEWDRSERMDDVEMEDVTSEEDESSDDDAYKTAKEGSPTPVKRRVTPAKQAARSSPRKAKGKASTSDDERADSDSHYARQSRSSSASSPSGADDDSESDDGGLAAVLARAKERVAAGTSLAAHTSPDTASVTTAPTTVSPAKPADGDDGIRRSSRARHAPEHYSPTRPGASAAVGRITSSSGTVKVKEATLGLQKRMNVGRNGMSFEKLMRERKAKEAQGKGGDWYARVMADLKEDSDEERDSLDGSDSDLERPSALSTFKTADATTVSRALDSDAEDDDLPGPSLLGGGKKKENEKKRQVDALEKVIVEERDRELGMQDEAETRAEKEERTVWRKGEAQIEALENVVKSWTGDGWSGMIAQELKAAVANPSRCPSAITLFSPLNPAGMGSQEEHVAVSHWLLSLLCHPSTPYRLAEVSHNLLNRLAAYTAKTTSGASPTLLSTDNLVAALIKLGAKPSGPASPASNGKGKEKEVEETPDSDVSLTIAQELLGSTQVTLTAEQRKQCVARWCRIVQVLSGTSPRLFSDHDALGLIAVCSRLALDPTSAALRGFLLPTIRELLRSMPADSQARNEVFRLFARIYRRSRPLLQFEVLQTLPHDSLGNRNLRKWLATSFLSSDEEVAKMRERPNISLSVFPALHALLMRPPSDSAFLPTGKSASDSAADTKLFEQAQILTIAVMELCDEIEVWEDKVEKRKILDEIVAIIERVEGRLLTNAKKSLAVERLKAKNTLYTLRQSISFQLKRARGQTHGFGFSNEEEEEQDESKKGGKKGEKGGRKKKRVRVEEPKDAVARVPTPASASTSATPALTPASSLASIAPLQLARPVSHGEGAQGEDVVMQDRTAAVSPPAASSKVNAMAAAQDVIDDELPALPFGNATAA
ncbi:hypothetical protein JCM11641_004079 [Rhodosporidiobolus odoratus]